MGKNSLWTKYVVMAITVIVVYVIIRATVLIGNHYKLF